MIQALPCPQCGATVHFAEASTEPKLCDFCQTRVPREAVTTAMPSWLVAFLQIGGVLAVIAVGVVFVYLGTNTPRDFPRQLTCRNSLKQIGIALSRYHADYACYPPAYVVDSQGQKLYSWRYFLLPMLEEVRLLREFDPSQAWDSKANAPLATRDIYSLRCAAAPQTPGGCHFVVIVDPQGAFTGSQPVRADEVRDGLSDTLAAIEVDDAIPWSAPHDPTLPDVLQWIARKKGLGGQHTDQAVRVLFLDGHVIAIPLDQLTPQLLGALVTRAGGEPVNLAGFH